MRFVFLLLFALLPCFGCGMFGGDDGEEERLSDYLYRGNRYFQSKKFNQALSQVDKGLEVNPDEIKLITLKGYILLEMGRIKRDPIYLESALEWFEKTVKGGFLSAAPRVDARLGLGMTLQGLGIEHKKRAKRLRARLQDGTYHPSKRKKAKEEAERSVVYSAQYLKRAEKVFAQILKEQESHILAIYHQALVKAELKKKEESLALFDRYIVVAGQTSTRIIQKQLPMVLDKKREDILWGKVHELEAKEISCRGLAATMLYEMKRYDGAILHLNKLLEMNPNQPNEYYNRACCYEKLNKNSAALKDFQTFTSVSNLPREDSRIRHALKFISKLKVIGGGAK